MFCVHSDLNSMRMPLKERSYTAAAMAAASWKRKPVPARAPACERCQSCSSDGAIMVFSPVIALPSLVSLALEGWSGPLLGGRLGRGWIGRSLERAEQGFGIFAPCLPNEAFVDHGGPQQEIPDVKCE